MTRKDYILIAEALNRAQNGSMSFECQRGIQRAIDYLSLALARDNPRFDRERFLKACGVQS